MCQRVDCLPVLPWCMIFSSFTSFTIYIFLGYINGLISAVSLLCICRQQKLNPDTLIHFVLNNTFDMRLKHLRDSPLYNSVPDDVMRILHVQRVAIPCTSYLSSCSPFIFTIYYVDHSSLVYINIY